MTDKHSKANIYSAYGGNRVILISSKEIPAYRSHDGSPEAHCIFFAALTSQLGASHIQQQMGPLVSVVQIYKINISNIRIYTQHLIP